LRKNKGEKHERRKVRDPDVHRRTGEVQVYKGKVKPEKTGFFCCISVYFLSFFVGAEYLLRPTSRPCGKIPSVSARDEGIETRMHEDKTAVERLSYW
jgi:hypothetical protein